MAEADLSQFEGKQAEMHFLLGGTGVIFVLLFSRTGFTFLLNLTFSMWMCTSSLTAFNMGKRRFCTSEERRKHVAIA